jgi:hypothetical protein
LNGNDAAQEITMFNDATNTAPVVLTDEQLELVSGGIQTDAGHIPPGVHIPSFDGQIVLPINGSERGFWQP